MNPTWRKLVLALIVLLAFPAPIWAQAPALAWTSYTTRDGLAAGAVSAIAVDGRGRVWVGTEGGGVSTFDGQRWVSHRLADNWIAALIADRDAVWAGTYGGGLSRFDGAKWQQFTAADSGLSNDWLTALASDAGGNLWVGTDGGGVNRFDGQQWTAHEPPGPWITALAADGDGVWVGGRDGDLWHFDGAQWTAHPVGSRVQAVAVDGHGRVWVGTGDGLRVFDGVAWRTYTAADGLPDDRVNAVATDADGRVWAGTARGVGVFDGVGWHTYTAADGLAADYVTAVAADAAGSVWVGTVAGVSRFGEPGPRPPAPLPVVLVHGWQDDPVVGRSQFWALAQWLERDGFPVYYAAETGPGKTLHENAQIVRATIERARAETGASQVSVVAHSMGGLVARAYVESALYRGDVAQVFMLGTPQAGLDLWQPLLLSELIRRPDDPSLAELTPEHAALFNRTHHPRPDVPYYLIAGDYRRADLPELHLPPGDGVVTLASAHALDGPAVRAITTGDVHGWGRDVALLGLRSYLWPEDTYDAHLRGPLRYPENRLRKSQKKTSEVSGRPHTPLRSGTLSAGQTITLPVMIDTPGPARFHLAWDRGELALALRDPSGTTFDAARVQGREDVAHFSFRADVMANLGSYVVERAAPGRWQMVVRRSDGGSPPAHFTAYAATDSPLRLLLSVRRERFALDGPVVIGAALADERGFVPGATVEARVVRPDGQSDRLPLLDDGAHHDNLADDGVYGGQFAAPPVPGYYPVFVEAWGTWQGRAFERAAETTVALSPPVAWLTGGYADRAEDADGDGRYERLLVEVGVETTVAGQYALAGRLTDTLGREVASTVVVSPLTAGRSTVTLPFDGTLIARSGRDGPYFVQSLVLMDATGASIAVDEVGRVYTTAAYRAADFEPAHEAR